jgi:hypothetical protein
VRGVERWRVYACGGVGARPLSFQPTWLSSVFLLLTTPTTRARAHTHTRNNTNAGPAACAHLRLLLRPLPRRGVPVSGDGRQGVQG